MRRRVFTCLVLATVLVAVVAIILRGAGISAVGRQPLLFEERTAVATWRYLVPREIRNRPNPVASTPEVLKGAREHWADHCALCHGNDGSGDTIIGRRVYPPVPDLRAGRTQGLSDGDLFYAIERGIPWTAMPGWTTSTSEGEQESWALVRFIRHLPSLSADEIKEMERLNPRPPPNPEREREIEDFLKGPPVKKGRGGGGH